MNCRDFILELDEELRDLPNKKRKTIVEIYQNKINTEIDLGTPEDKIIEGLPTPYDIAKDIYEKEGINYLERRKRRNRSNAVVKTILSIFLLILLISAALVITFFIGYEAFNLIRLLTLMISIKEVILMALLVIPLILLIIVIYLYLFDLFVLLFNLAIENIALGFKKDVKLKDISITSFLEEKFKKPKLFKKILISLVVVTVLFGIVNIVFKTYFYRSFTKTDPINYHISLDLSEYSFDDIYLDIDEAKVYYKTGDKLMIELSSEFERNINTEISGNTLEVTSDHIKTFDLLNFLKEPLPIITIYLPKEYNINFNMHNGYIYLESLNLNNISGTIDLGNLIISKSTLKNVNLKNTSSGINIVDTNINDLSFTTIDGFINIESSNILSIDVNNQLAEYKIKNSQVDDLLINTYGIFNIENLTSTNLKATIGSRDMEVSGGTINSINIKTGNSGTVSIGNLKSNKIEVVDVGGDIVIYNVEAELNLQTGRNLTIQKSKGNMTLSALGNFVSIQEVTGSIISLETETTETSIKFIQADSFTYKSINSKSTLYFIFSENIYISDYRGEVLLDNDSKIITSDSDITLYTVYYQNVDKLTISSNVKYRVNEEAEVIIE